MTSHEPGATARRVAEVRALRRLTQSQLATAAAVSLSLIRKIEQALAEPPPTCSALLPQPSTSSPAH